MTSFEISAYSEEPVEFLPYDPVCQDVAGALASLIEARATDAIVEHVGSTAVPGCGGKGVIDLALLFPEGGLERAVAALDQLGFQRQGGRDPFPESRPMRIGAVTYGGQSFRVHVHVIASGSAKHVEIIAFRDLLRRDPDARAEYEAAKKAILASGIRQGVVYAREKSFAVQRLSRRSGDHLFVVSGCSGSGKSTLIAALEQRGEAVATEPGRQIVKEEIQRGGDGLPWANRQRFIDLCAERAIRDFDRHAQLRRRTFFDRGFIDVASAVELTGLIAPAPLKVALQSKRYAPLVFISPPWEALFRSDPERRHAFSDALAEYAVLLPTYHRHGYEVVFLPQAPVPERVAFVLSTVSSWEKPLG